jgi:hypothetical protein
MNIPNPIFSKAVLITNVSFVALFYAYVGLCVSGVVNNTVKLLVFDNLYLYYIATLVALISSLFIKNYYVMAVSFVCGISGLTGCFHFDVHLNPYWYL